MQTNNKKIYIILSQTGTLFARLLKIITGDEYNHASISLDRELTQMYSFGRKVVNNPFNGGFIHESLSYGVFGKFRNTKAMIVEVELTDEQFLAIQNKINQMDQMKGDYKYNFRGLFFGVLHIPCKRKFHFYCSEFVRNILQDIGFNIEVPHNKCVKPKHLLQVEHTRVYKGNLHAYPSFIAKHR